MSLPTNLCVKFLLLLLCLLIAAFDTSFCLRYKVGDSVWSIPPSQDFYTNWSSSIVFYIGDSLVFEFEPEYYNVIQVSKLDYESCTSNNPTKILSASPAIVVLGEEGVFYYLCNISNYCELGQKISFIVHRHYSLNSPPTPSPSPSPSILSPSTPFLAPQPFPGGFNNTLPSPSPSPDSTLVPSQIINVIPSAAPSTNYRIIYGGIITAHWAFNFLF